MNLLRQTGKRQRIERDRAERYSRQRDVEAIDDIVGKLSGAAQTLMQTADQLRQLRLRQERAQ
jgi:hypothetical protein